MILKVKSLNFYLYKFQIDIAVPSPLIFYIIYFLFSEDPTTTTIGPTTTGNSETTTMGPTTSVGMLTESLIFVN